LEIKKGTRVGITGESGSGKSTLLDILMGLMQPTHGFMEIDSILINEENCSCWMANVAHVPQSIFLSDNSIAENIAFGIPIESIDMHKVIFAAEQAQIAATIESFEYGYKTLVGERGIRLSGGQRQRIGIARALYKQAMVIVLDEATSALDRRTESSLIESLNAISTDITIITVAHRLTTLKGCDVIYNVSQGRVFEV
jgi:ATP-binding cassette subfamily B protein